MAYDEGLTHRIRDTLAATPSREVKMFGGLSFLVDDRMIVCASRDGGLLVRTDPDRSDELLTTAGAQPAEMGAGRAMGESWISVAGESIASDQSLDFWIGVALEFNKRETDRRQTRPSAEGAWREDAKGFHGRVS